MISTGAAGLAFFSVVFCLFWLLANRRVLRWLLLLCASYAYFTAQNGAWVLLLFLCTALDFICGYAIYFARARGLKLCFVAISIACNLGLLFYFKYFTFFLENVGAALAFAGHPTDWTALEIIVPVGISFYTLQSLSYGFDIYRGQLEPAPAARYLFLCVGFFPTLLAGPIVRARELLPQLVRAPKLSEEDFGEGVYRILRGSLKRMFFAELLAQSLVDPVFRDPSRFGSAEVMLALAAFHLQIYCDLSGAADIALGSARLLGLRLPENFDVPYLAHSPTNFWNRWAMTLSRFCQDYIFRPLSANDPGRVSAHIYTLVTFLAIGLWFGPSWNFVFFGAFHAVGVIMTALSLAFLAWVFAVSTDAVDHKLGGRLLPVLATNIFVMLSWPLFRAPDLQTALATYSRLLVWQGPPVGVNLLALVVLTLAVTGHFIPNRLENRLINGFVSLTPLSQATIAFAAIVALDLRDILTLELARVLF